MDSLKNKQEVISQLNSQVGDWTKKLKFSLVSLIFFSVINLVNLVNPIFGQGSVILFSVATLIFIQQSIRSYNYLKFSKITLKATELFYEEMENL